MTVNETLANTARAAHDVGLAAWLGGAMFGKFAHNPSLEKITSHNERGSVANDAWGRYNVINTLGMGARPRLAGPRRGLPRPRTPG